MVIAELPRRDGPLPGRDETLPRRDGAARARLLDLARRTSPVTRAEQRRIPVAGELGGLLPGGGIPRGGVVSVDGDAAGRTVAHALAAATTTAEEWAALVDDDVGGLALLEAGIDPQRLAVVRGVPRTRWAGVVAALVEGMSLVLAATPVGLRTGDARRLTARARERDCALVVLGHWPAEAALRISVDHISREPVTREPVRGAVVGEASDLLLGTPHLHLRIEGRTAPVAGRVVLAG